MANINHSRLYLGAMLEYFQLWKEVRDKVKTLSVHVTNIENKWKDFAELSPIMGKDSVAAMGGNEKPPAMPDDMTSGPTISITAEKVIILYDTATKLGFEFNSEKIYKPTVPKDDPDYAKQMAEALELWNVIADIYFQVKDNFYKIGSLRGAYGKLQGSTDFDAMDRTPGQLALNFPNTMTFLLENDHPIFNRQRYSDEFKNEYYYWLNRSNINMIQSDPPKYETDAIPIETADFAYAPKSAEEAAETDPTLYNIYTFSAPENSIIVGVDFCKAHRTINNGTDPATESDEEYVQVDNNWIYDYQCATNQVRLAIPESHTLTNLLLIAVTLSPVSTE